MDGTGAMTQSWIAPRHPQLPLAIRQLISWNRTRYQALGEFYDTFGDYLPARPLVPVSAKLTPLLTNNTPNNLAGHMQATGTRSMPGLTCNFPALLADNYRVDLSWAQDEFTNTFNVQYARIEIEPSLRLEAIAGNNLGVVNLNGNGEADPAGKVIKISTGFPLREAQLMIKVTYPWVALWNSTLPALPSIINAGPVGDWWSEVVAGPPMGILPKGQYLGSVNSVEFLGFPKGRVLYQSAEMVERVSPVTTRLGYQITHVFLVLTGASWNHTRYEGPMGENGFVPQANANQGDEFGWPYGATVAIKKDGTVYQVNGKVVYPYIHRDLNNLLYYGSPNDPYDINSILEA